MRGRAGRALEVVRTVARGLGALGTVDVLARAALGREERALWDAVVVAWYAAGNGRTDVTRAATRPSASGDRMEPGGPAFHAERAAAAASAVVEERRKRWGTP